MKWQVETYDNKLFYIIAFVILIATASIHFYFLSKYDKKESERFDSTFVNEKIISVVSKGRGGTEITTTLGTYKQPIYVYDWDDPPFRYFAEKGDSIYKPKYADTLRLIKKDSKEVYYYRVHSYSD